MDETTYGILWILGLLLLAYYTDRRKKRSRSRLSQATRRRVYRRDGAACQYCGKPIPYQDMAHVDHRRPVSRGGTSEEENLILACPSCNLRKGAKMPWEAGMRDPNANRFWSVMDRIRGIR